MTTSTPTPPNIVFILSDDQGPWAMGCAGNPEIRTPNLDRLAGSGMRFTNYFCTSPVCSPARATLMTGRIPSRHGVHDWLSEGHFSETDRETRRPAEYLEGQPGITDFLAEAGYTCGLSGKWHLGDSCHPQKSMTFWKVHARGGGPYYNAPMVEDGKVIEEPRYVTDAITDNALEFLAQHGKPEKPFYLGVHYTAPHSPWGRDHHPHALYDDYAANCAFHSVPNVQPHRWQNRPGLFPPDAEARRQTLSGYFTAVTAMDANVGRLLDDLEARGLRNNTLVVFTSDNGMNMGHHGIYGKGNGTFPLNMFDSSVKVPFIASQPGTIPAGTEADALYSHLDMMPSILDWAAVEPPRDDKLPGESFAETLRGSHGNGHDRVVVFEEYGPTRMIRSREWKYVHRFPYGPHELYDLTADPDEIHNLVDRPDRQERVEAMRQELNAWFARYADPDMDGSVLPVTGGGQRDFVDPARRTCCPFGGTERVWIHQEYRP